MRARPRNRCGGSSEAALIYAAAFARLVVVGSVPLSSPPCPVDYATKDWVEDSLHLLGSVFGNDTLRDTVVIEPTDEFFANAYEPSRDGARSLLKATAGHIGTSAEELDVRIVSRRDEIWLAEDADFDEPAAHQVDQSGICFAIADDDLSQPDRLVGMFGRELGALRLVEEVGVNPDAYDFCPLADLTATFVGLGLFIGAVPYIPPDDEMPGSRPTPLTLPPHALAYALAHVAWHQDVDDPSWLSYLTSDVKACFKSSLHYLQQTEASDFPPRRSR